MEPNRIKFREVSSGAGEGIGSDPAGGLVQESVQDLGSGRYQIKLRS